MNTVPQETKPLKRPKPRGAWVLLQRVLAEATEPLTAADLVLKTGVTRPNVEMSLLARTRAGDLERSGGRPYRYALKAAP